MKLTEQMMTTFESLMHDFPDWLAWRIEAWVVQVEDRQRLSPPVFDAWWWTA